jgi:hypothetical protein
MSSQRDLWRMVAMMAMLAAPALMGANECGGGGPSATECVPAECGPEPGAPAYECADGSLGGSTGRCLRAADGTCGWELRECPAVDCGLTPVACDALPPECAEGERAVVAEGCWTGACAPLEMCERADCDGSRVLCDTLPPECPEGMRPSAGEGCWGPCVPSELCADCRTSGCAEGSTCSACPGPGAVVYACVPDGAAC